jgi:small subunit ribosomal protein S8
MSSTTTDPIADMLTRIRNAIAVQKYEVSLPHSQVKESVARLLKSSNFVDDVNVSDAKVGKTLTVKINSENSSA